MATNSRLAPSEIVSHAKRRFGKLNPLQDFVVTTLVDKARERNLVFTKGAINYLLREIEDPDILEDLAESQAEDVLSELLSVAIENSQRWNPKEHKRPAMEKEFGDSSVSLVLLSYSSIVRALRVFPCPKPWC